MRVTGEESQLGVEDWVGTSFHFRVRDESEGVPGI